MLNHFMKGMCRQRQEFAQAQSQVARKDQSVSDKGSITHSAGPSLGCGKSQKMRHADSSCAALFRGGALRRRPSEKFTKREKEAPKEWIDTMLRKIKTRSQGSLAGRHARIVQNHVAIMQQKRALSTRRRIRGARECPPG